MFYPGSFESGDIEDVKDMLEDSVNDDYHLTNRASWGIFLINGSTITIEKWWHASGGNREVRQEKGIIQGDTSVVIGDDEYFFDGFSPKPDSTNMFVL